MLGEYKQLNIFEIEYETKVKNKYETIKEKLSKYKIDEIYIKKFRGQSTVLWVINEELKKQKDYEKYYEELYQELLKYIPQTERDYNFKNFGIFKGNDTIFYQIGKHTENGLEYNGAIGPIFCLEMLPKAMLGSD